MCRCVHPSVAADFRGSRGEFETTCDIPRYVSQLQCMFSICFQILVNFCSRKLRCDIAASALNVTLLLCVRVQSNFEDFLFLHTVAFHQAEFQVDDNQHRYLNCPLGPKCAQNVLEVVSNGRGNLGHRSG